MGKRNKGRKNENRKQDRGTVRGNKGQGAGQRWRGKSLGWAAGQIAGEGKKALGCRTEVE